MTRTVSKILYIDVSKLKKSRDRNNLFDTLEVNR